MAKVTKRIANTIQTWMGTTFKRNAKGGIYITARGVTVSVKADRYVVYSNNVHNVYGLIFEDMSQDGVTTLLDNMSRVKDTYTKLSLHLHKRGLVPVSNWMVTPKGIKGVFELTRPIVHKMAKDVVRTIDIGRYEVSFEAFISNGNEFYSLTDKVPNKKVPMLRKKKESAVAGSSLSEEFQVEEDKEERKMRNLVTETLRSLGVRRALVLQTNDWTIRFIYNGYVIGIKLTKSLLTKKLYMSLFRYDDGKTLDSHKEELTDITEEKLREVIKEFINRKESASAGSYNPKTDRPNNNKTELSMKGFELA